MADQKKDTAAFFRFIHEMNETIEEGKVRSSAGLDPIRVARDAERRERLGQLRARPKKRKKTGEISSVFGHINLGE